MRTDGQREERVRKNESEQWANRGESLEFCIFRHLFSPVPSGHLNCIYQILYILLAFVFKVNCSLQASDLGESFLCSPASSMYTACS